jgi:hypothetical protein
MLRHQQPVSCPCVAQSRALVTVSILLNPLILSEAGGETFRHYPIAYRTSNNEIWLLSSGMMMQEVYLIIRLYLDGVFSFSFVQPHTGNRYRFVEILNTDRQKSL